MPTKIPITAKQRDAITQLNASAQTASEKANLYIVAILDGNADVPENFHGITFTPDGLVLGDAEVS